MGVRKLTRTPKAKCGFEIKFGQDLDIFVFMEWVLVYMGKPDGTRWRSEWVVGQMGKTDTLKFYFDDENMADTFAERWTP